MISFEDWLEIHKNVSKEEAARLLSLTSHPDPHVGFNRLYKNCSLDEFLRFSKLLLLYIKTAQEVYV